MKALIEEYPESYAKYAGNHGKFKLFQVALNFMPGRPAIQPKCHLDFDKIADEILILEKMA